MWWGLCNLLRNSMLPSPSPSYAKTKGMVAGAERTTFAQLIVGSVAVAQSDKVNK